MIIGDSTVLKTASLPPQIKQIVIDKGTEYPYSQEDKVVAQSGTYLCRQCGLALFRGESKFNSGCGWPSFDKDIADHVKKQMDSDGRRIEIVCSRCDAHLGHVFNGEGFTPLNTRHCVNSLALDFVAHEQIMDSQEAILAAGCFWGVEYYMQNLPGVVKTEVGYGGGYKDSPTYKEVCAHTTGHLEVIRVVFDPQVISYEQILMSFFEIHDFSQTNGQGPDIGEQYLSAIFYYNQEQLQTAKELIKLLENKGYTVATQLREVSIFWPAEDYHQDYYTKEGKEPYCHRHEKRQWRT